jgi:DNA processing protein
MKSPQPLTDAERLDWLRLLRSERIGPATFRRLLERFGSAAAALDALPTIARRAGGARPPAIASIDGAAEELAAAAAAGAQAIALCEAAYPPLLRQIDDAPPLLYVLGDAALLARPAVGIVGTRNASLNGRRLAERLAADLGAAGYLIVSGMARGIDTAAHGAALKTGTAAVLAGGVDVVYPPENAALHRAIAAAGVVISEIAPGTEPQAGHFPRRNRLISGVSRGIVVVEAALRSGALITARMALEQGREVFAVPGSPLDPRSRGPNDLIRQGAILAEDADDVLNGLAGVITARHAPGEMESEAPETPPPASESDMDAALRLLEEALSPAPATVDELVRSCQLSPAVVTTVLLELELAGRLERHPGNRVALVAGP